MTEYLYCYYDRSFNEYGGIFTTKYTPEETPSNFKDSILSVKISKEISKEKVAQTLIPLRNCDLIYLGYRDTQKGMIISKFETLLNCDEILSLNEDYIKIMNGTIEIKKGGKINVK